MVMQQVLTRPCLISSLDFSSGKGSVDFTLYPLHYYWLAGVKSVPNLELVYVVNTQLRGGAGSGWIITPKGSFKITYAWSGITHDYPMLISGEFVGPPFTEPFRTHTYTTRAEPAAYLPPELSFHELLSVEIVTDQMGLSLEEAKMPEVIAYYQAKRMIAQDVSHRLFPRLSAYMGALHSLVLHDYNIAAATPMYERYQAKHSIPPTLNLLQMTADYPTLQREHLPTVLAASHPVVALPRALSLSLPLSSLTS